MLDIRAGMKSWTLSLIATLFFCVGSCVAEKPLKHFALGGFVLALCVFVAELLVAGASFCVALHFFMTFACVL
jgi:hypothetical protein